MKARLASFGIIFVIYAAAAVCGIALYGALPFDYRLSLLIADVCATVFVFVFSVIFKNASVYDPYWSVAPIVILTGFAFSAKPTLYTILLLLAVWLWGLRLTANWVYAFHGPRYEDWRYRMLREKTGGLYPFVNLFGIHLFPTLVVYACILPAVTAGLIREGLWKYARHPNYLGEILMWWGIGLSFATAGGSFLYFAGALVNHLMFLFISIPMADKRQSQKEGREEYRARTRALIPVRKTL